MTNHKPFSYTHIRLESVDSTNSYLSSLLTQNPSLEQMTVVSTVDQTAGRGQGANRWSSESGKNLTFSVLMRPVIKAEDHFYLTICVSLAIADLLAEYTDGIRIKWPNDIYHKDKKICGILIQSALCGNKISTAIAGIGINVNQKEFESWVPNPTSLKIITCEEYDLSAVLDGVMERLFGYYQKLLTGEKSFLEEKYLSMMYLRGEKSRFEDSDGEFVGVIDGVEPSGLLRIRRENGEVSVYDFKRVKYLR